MLVSVKVPFGRMEKDVRDDGGLELVVGWESGIGGGDFSGEGEGEGDEDWDVDMPGELVRNAPMVGDSGESIGAGEGECAFFFFMGEGITLVRFWTSAGRFLIVVTAKGEIASTIAWVLIGSSSSLSEDFIS